jgi:hypothetical protein
MYNTVLYYTLARQRKEECFAGSTFFWVWYLSMQKLTRPGMEKHWRNSTNTFRAQYRDWIMVFWDIVPAVSEVLNLLEGKGRLAENCSYLLLSKSLNHALATFSLAERGLCIDAALASRNAIETLLLMQALMLDSSEDFFRRWSQGEEFKPGWVRKELKAKSSSAVRDVIITMDQETHDLNRMLYGWLSNITHANLNSLNQTVRKTGEQSYEVFVGGSLDGMGALMNAVFAGVCYGLYETAIMCMAVFEPTRLEKSKLQWATLGNQINQAARPHTTT